MSFSPYELIATDGSSNPVSCAPSNSNGCDLSVSFLVGGGTPPTALFAAMTQDLSTSGSPQFTDLTCSNTLLTVAPGTYQIRLSNPSPGQTQVTFNNGQAKLLFDSSGTILYIQPWNFGGPITMWSITSTSCTIPSTAFFNVNDTTDSTSSTTGCAVFAGGLGIAKHVNMGGNLVVNSTRASTSSITGCAVHYGGFGVAGDINIGGNSSTSSDSSAVNANVGGPITVVGVLSSDSQLNATATTDSTSTTTGELISSGGAGIAKSLYVGGQINDTSTTDSTSTTTGAIVTAGGMGVGGHIYCSGLNFGGGALSNFINTDSWIPALQFGNTISPTMTYSAQTGSYCRIGPLVFCCFTIILTNKGTTTGVATINLPRPASSAIQPQSSLGGWGLVSLSTGYTQITVDVTSSSMQAALNQCTSANNTYNTMSNTNFSNSSGLWGAFYYFA